MADDSMSIGSLSQAKSEGDRAEVALSCSWATWIISSVEKPIA